MGRENVTYKGFLVHNGEIMALKEEAKIIQKLDSSAYSVVYRPMQEQLVFSQIKLSHDEIVHIPNSAQDEISKEIDLFLSIECRKRFKEVGLLPKNNILLYGLPGTGKTVLVNDIANKIIASGGTVILNPPVNALPHISVALNDTQPDKLTLIIMEEIDEAMIGSGETSLLHFLDGELQNENLIFIATTNFIERIPDRIKRPGRFAVVKEIGLPCSEARRYYLHKKLSNHPDLVELIVKNTDGFTIDQLKEVVRLTFCMQKPIEESIERAKRRDIVTTKNNNKTYINNVNLDQQINQMYGQHDDFFDISEE